MALKIDSFKKGQILYHRKHEYGKKFLVVLNNTGTSKEDECIYCLTTSTYGRKEQPPCDHIHGHFFVPVNEYEFFDRKTWLLLDDVNSATVGDIIEDVNRGEIVTGERQFLSEQTVRELINCIKKLMDIDTDYYDLIIE